MLLECGRFYSWRLWKIEENIYWRWACSQKMEGNLFFRFSIIKSKLYQMILCSKILWGLLTLRTYFNDRNFLLVCCIFGKLFVVIVALNHKITYYLFIMLGNATQNVDWEVEHNYNILSTFWMIKNVVKKFKIIKENI